MNNSSLKNKSAYDKWSSSYDDGNNPHILMEHKSVLEIVNPKKGDFILDAGCGTGKYTTEFYNNGAKVIGIDISDKMIEKALEKNNDIEYKTMDLSSNLDFQDNSFDKINCSQVLKHIPDIEVTFKEFHRILKSGGELTFSVTHPDRPRVMYRFNKKMSFNLAEESDIFHHRFFDYFNAFDKSGFKIIQIKQIVLNDDVKHIINEEDFKEMQGRPEIVIFNLKK